MSQIIVTVGQGFLQPLFNYLNLQETLFSIPSIEINHKKCFLAATERFSSFSFLFLSDFEDEDWNVHSPLARSCFQKKTMAFRWVSFHWEFMKSRDFITFPPQIEKLSWLQRNLKKMKTACSPCTEQKKKSCWMFNLWTIERSHTQIPES